MKKLKLAWYGVKFIYTLPIVLVDEWIKSLDLQSKHRDERK